MNLLLILPAFNVILTAVLVIALRKSLKKTLYDYKNIMLVGIILFLSVMAFSFLLNITLGQKLTVRNIYKSVVEFPHKFSYYALFVITAVCILVGISNIELIRREGFRVRNALSLLIAALYIGGTFILYFAFDLAEKFIVNDNKLVICIYTSLSLFLLLVLCYFECVLFGTAFMGYKAARQKPCYDKDYIIILGCSIDKKGGLLPLLKGRVNRAVRFAWEQEMNSGKPLKYVPSGGQGSNEIISEGSAMALYLLTKGAEDYEVFPEKKSTNTYENMLFSKRIIDSLNPDAKIAFATTNYHMLRSGIIARSVGIDAEGIAGDTKWYFWPNGFIREFFGILVMNIKEHIAVSSVLLVISLLLGFLGMII